MKKALMLIFALAILLIFAFTACADTQNDNTPSDTVDNSENASQPNAESWQSAYAEFLREATNYAEDGYFAETFALVDLDNSSVPELIIVYYDGVQGGAIFANIYLYYENISIIGQRIDMYYKTAWLSTNPLFPGLFVEGGRNSTFSCNYWTITDNEFTDEPLWSFAPDYNNETYEMEYKDLSANEQLITESKKFPSSLPDYSGTLNWADVFEFFEITAENITKVIYAEVKEPLETDYGIDSLWFSEGFAQVSKNDKYGFINEELELIVPCIYDSAEDFYGGVAVVSKDGKWGAVDTTGEVAVPLIYDFIRIGFTFDEGLAFFIKDGKLGYVHKSGKEIVPPIYDFSFHQDGSSTNDSQFFNGFAMVERNGKFGFIDEAGEEVIPLIYGGAAPFYGELGKVLKEGEWYDIDKTGNIISLSKFD